MYRLDVESVVQWAESGGNKHPESFDTVCPYCGKQVNFQLVEWSADSYINAASVVARCTRCSNNVAVWSVDSGSELYMRPEPVARQPIEGAESMPTAVRQAYQDTIDVFNAGVWSATATQTRRTLEGIVHELLPEEERSGPLAQQLRKLAESESVNLAGTAT